MSQIEITPALLADLRQKAEKVEPNDYILTDGLVIKSESFMDLTIADCAFSDDAEYIAAASPAVVLALIDEVERLRGTQDELAETLSDVLRHTDLSGWKLGEQIEKDATDLLKRIKEANNARQA